MFDNIREGLFCNREKSIFNSSVGPGESAMSYSSVIGQKVKGGGQFLSDFFLN